MKWNYKELCFREDWEDAFNSITQPEQARAFMEAARSFYGKETENVVGYLTGELDGFENAKAKRALLGIRHPLNPEERDMSGTELLMAGFQCNVNPPSWLPIVLAIPSKDPKRLSIPQSEV